MMATKLPSHLQAELDKIPHFKTTDFYLVCEKCGTGHYAESPEQMELPCQWEHCGNPHLSVFKKIVQGGK